jgi:DNA-binding CsgD family transcriptional regulator/PAS domain-containing protein
VTEVEKFSAVVAQIYDCVADPTRWPAVLGDFTEDFEGVIATIAVLDIKNNRSRFGAAFGDPSIVEPLVKKYAAEMPFYDLVQKIPTDVPVTIQQFCALHSPNGINIFKDSRLWQEWFVPNNIVDMAATNIINANNRVAAIVLNFSGDRKPVNYHDLERLSLLMPHVRRAITISDLFEDRENAHAMMQSVVDHMTTAIFVVDQKLKLKYANSSAEDLLRSEVLVSTSNEIVKFQNSHAHAAVQRAIVTGERNEFTLGTLGIGVPLALAQAPMLAHVLPLNRRSTKNDLGDGTAAIFIANDDNTPVAGADALAALFGLTAAEKRVATAVANGKLRAEIALEHGVSDGTIKAQLEAIYAKTGTASQRSLQMLVRDLTPPLRTLTT